MTRSSNSQSAAIYRHERDRERQVQAGLVGSLIALVFLGGTAAYLPGATWAGSQGTSPGPGGNIAIALGSPAVKTMACSDGEATAVEIVPWINASIPLGTADVHLELVELIDGDIDGGPIAPPVVTATSLCGAPLVEGWPAWYIVLQGPSGANSAYFSYSQYWVNLAHPGQPLAIEPGSSLIMVSTQSFAHLSFGLCILGSAAYPALDTCTRL